MSVFVVFERENEKKKKTKAGRRKKKLNLFQPLPFLPLKKNKKKLLNRENLEGPRGRDPRDQQPQRVRAELRGAVPVRVKKRREVGRERERKSFCFFFAVDSFSFFALFRRSHRPRPLLPDKPTIQTPTTATPTTWSSTSAAAASTTASSRQSRPTSLASPTPSSARRATLS